MNILLLLLVSLLLFIILLSGFVDGNIRWLGIRHFPDNNIWEVNNVCKKHNGFSGRQVKFCRRQFPWMFFTQDAAKETADECQTILKDRKWNCQTLDKAPNFNMDLKKDTKESAFIHSLSASSLAFTVSHGCLAGKLKECACQHVKRQVTFSSKVINEKNLTNSLDDLVGCKGILEVGQKFAREFLMNGIRSKPKTERHKREIAVRRHNINLGLKGLDNGEYISCTCNGATANCAMKFCHRRLVSFQDVSARLLQKYFTARKVQRQDFYNVSKVSNHGQQRNYYALTGTNAGRMLYLDSDVNYCETNKEQYSSTGRRCTMGNERTDSCNKICCGKGHRIRKIEIHSKCKCKFIYCCKVVCETCVRYDNIYECL